MGRSPFLSTLPVRGATANRLLISTGQSAISIHAPREGSDHAHPRHPWGGAAFLSTLPVRGATPAGSPRKHGPAEFLSTLPVRGATLGSTSLVTHRRFLSTLPVRGATVRLPAPQRKPEISIHAPREGSDSLHPMASMYRCTFLSTLPVRGATCCPTRTSCRHPNFYPRSP